MRTLYLIRHAKSSWNDMSVDDFDRTLNNRGKRDAPIMAQWLKDKISSLDAIISSPAKRAKKTAKQFADIFDIEVEYHNALYHAGQEEIFSSVYGADDRHSSIAIFGHNPGFTYFANTFASDQNYIDNVPTCGIVAIQSSAGKWSGFNDQNSKIQFFMYPKKLT